MGRLPLSTGRRARVIWLVLVSPLVCVFVGATIGAGYFALVATSSGSVPPLRAITGFPTAMMYALLFAGPFGLIAGVSGALLASALAEGTLRGATKRRWLRGGAGLGATVGLVLGLYSVMTGGPLSSMVMTVLACGSSGAIVGWFAWREFGEHVMAG